MLLMLTNILKANVGLGVSTWTISGSELLLRLEPCCTSTHRSATCKYVLFKIQSFVNCQNECSFWLALPCRITTFRLECLQRWWTPRPGRCPSPMCFTSPSLPRRRHHPSLCQRLTMRWKNYEIIGSRIFLLAGHDVPDWQTPLQSLHKSLKISTVFQMTLMC